MADKTSKSFKALFSESKPVVNEIKTSNFNSLYNDAPASLKESTNSWNCYESVPDSGPEFTTQGGNNRSQVKTSKPVFEDVSFKSVGDHGFQGSVLYINGVGKDTTASGPINTMIKRKSANHRNTPADFSSCPEKAVNAFNRRYMINETKLDVSFNSSGKPFLNFPPGMNTQEIINVVDALTAFAQTWVYPSSLSVVDQRHVVAAIPDATSATNFPSISNRKTTEVNYSVVAKGGNQVPSTPAIEANARTQYKAALKLVETRDSLEKQLAKVVETEAKLPELKAAAEEEDDLANQKEELEKQLKALKEKQKALQAKKSN